MKKSLTFRLKCAQTFAFKSRCKFCASGPKYVCFIMSRFIDEKSFTAFRKYYTNNYYLPQAILSDKYYLEESIKERSFKISYLFDGGTMYHRNLIIPNSKYDQSSDRFISLLECDCSKTSWAFVDSKRMHIKNRKNDRLSPVKNIQSLYKVMI